jgi:hypothetical protein
MVAVGVTEFCAAASPAKSNVSVASNAIERRTLFNI